MFNTKEKKIRSIAKRFGLTPTDKEFNIYIGYVQTANWEGIRKMSFCLIMRNESNSHEESFQIITSMYKKIFDKDFKYNLSYFQIELKKLKEADIPKGGYPVQEPKLSTLERYIQGRKIKKESKDLISVMLNEVGKRFSLK